MGFRVWGLGFGVWIEGLGFRVEGFDHLGGSRTRNSMSSISGWFVFWTFCGWSLSRVSGFWGFRGLGKVGVTVWVRVALGQRTWFMLGCRCTHNLGP